MARGSREQFPTELAGGGANDTQRDRNGPLGFDVWFSPLASQRFNPGLGHAVKSLAQREQVVTQLSHMVVHGEPPSGAGNVPPDIFDCALHHRGLRACTRARVRSRA